MVVGVLRVEIHLPESRSLKDKRKSVKSVLGRLRASYNVCAAETGHQDLRQRATLGVACVAPTGYQANRLLKNIEKEIESKEGIEIVRRSINVDRFDDDEEWSL